MKRCAHRGVGPYGRNCTAVASARLVGRKHHGAWHPTKNLCDEHAHEELVLYRKKCVSDGWEWSVRPMTWLAGTWDTGCDR